MEVATAKCLLSLIVRSPTTLAAGIATPQISVRLRAALRTIEDKRKVAGNARTAQRQCERLPS